MLDLLLVNDCVFQSVFSSYISIFSIQQSWSTKNFISFLLSSSYQAKLFLCSSLSIHINEKKNCRDDFIDPPSPSLLFYFHTQWDDLWWPFLLFLFSSLACYINFLGAWCLNDHSFWWIITTDHQVEIFPVFCVYSSWEIIEW